MDGLFIRGKEMSFWSKLPRPFTVLAPMEEVADTVFRQIVLRAGRPDVFFTEFTNVEGIEYAVRNPRAGVPVLQRLCFSEIERPIAAQIWGKRPENFYKTARMLVDMKFDGIDINMGCPEKSVLKSGCCIALINNRNLAKEIIQATKEGAGKLPVSLKTRIGLEKPVTEDWCGWLLEQNLDALTVHGRTAKEKSDVPAHWEEIGKVVKLRDEMKLNTLVIGNGDVRDAEDARLKAREYGVDGVMIGRGVFENPFLFSTKYEVLSTKEEKKRRLELLRQHVKLWEETWGDTKNFAIMKKFFKMYVKGWEGAGELRARLMEAGSTKEVEAIVGSD